MPTVTVNLPANGETAYVTKYNAAINAILSVLNGGVASDNLADAAVIAAKLADNAVTNTKIAANAVDTTKMNIPKQTGAGGTAGSYFQIGSFLVCFGETSVANAGTAITFPKAFSATPTVVCTTRDTNNQTGWASAVSATGATLKQIYTTTSLPVNWVAIGPA